ncbi:unnamed protein product [Alopecurus aequalis]
MPSWNDGETDSEGRLSGLSGSSFDGGYTPDVLEDPSFEGLAIDSTQLCNVHKQLPERFVAYEGTNTGRQFLACAVKNEIENCGFVAWIDPEWPDSLQYALSSLWTKVEEVNHARISAKIDHALLVKNLMDDKTKAEKKYSSLMAEVNNLMDDLAGRARQENYSKIMKDEEGQGQHSGISEFARLQVVEGELEKVVTERNNLNLELEKVVKEKNTVKEDLLKLKEVQKHDSDMLDLIQKKREEEREVMKEEKKKLEYMLYDMLKLNDGNKEKLKRIKLICEE